MSLATQAKLSELQRRIEALEVLVANLRPVEPARDTRKQAKKVARQATQGAAR